MKIEKKHKIYAGLVGAALVAWGIDAVFFESSPASNSPVAEAAVVATPKSDPAPAGAVSSVAAESREPNSGQWLGERLSAWSEKNPDAVEKVRDIFSTPASWVPQRAAAPQPAPVKVAEDFQRDHHLTAVVLGASGGSAVIDGRLLRVGQSVGGCRLKSVSSGCADLLGPDGREFRVLIGPEGDKNVK